MENVFTFQININLSASHLRPDDPQRVREEGGLRGPRRAPGPGRGAALHRLGLWVNLYVPAPRISLCRHAEPGCGVAAKKSQVRPRSRRINATIVDETSLLGVTTVRGGGGASLRARDRGLGHGHGDSSQLSKLKPTASFYTSLLHFYYRGYETRMQGDSYNYVFRGQPSLGGHQDNYCNPYYSCNVPQDRVMGGRECNDIISLCSRV